MPQRHEYRHPHAKAANAEEEDSDLELDIHELGPRPRSNGDTVSGKAPSFNDQQTSRTSSKNAIPLRALRNNGPRSSGRRSRQPARQTSTDTSIGDGYTGDIRDGDGDADADADADGIDSSDTLNIGDATPLLDPNSVGLSPVQRNTSFIDFLRRPWRSAWFSKYSRLDGGLDDTGSEPPTKNGIPRTIHVGQRSQQRFPSNAISNAKYTPISFLPRTLYNEFSFFINLYFLLIALSQLIPPLRIGLLWAYIAPLVFVLMVTLGKEAYDDIARRQRDAEANRELYTLIRLRDVTSRNGLRGKGKSPQNGRPRAKTMGQRRMQAIVEEEENVGYDDGAIELDEISVKSKDIRVGDVLKLSKDQRVPADMIILKAWTTESALTNASAQASAQSGVLFEQEVPSDGHELPKIGTTVDKEPEDNTASSAGSDGETFIRTDQLDGETDWKLRLASPLTQRLNPREFVHLTITASKPSRNVNEFVGKLEMKPKLGDGKGQKSTSTALSIDNTAWANTVLASSATVLALVVYTGGQTRQALSTSASRSKTGLLEFEINNLTKILCILTLTLSGVLVGLQAYLGKLDHAWYISLTRFLILFSSIIPIALRVNLDLAKSVYAYYIERDREMPGAVVRTSTIPEDLGRIEYLLSDKTGTLTQNEMDLRKIHVGTVSYANEAMEEVASYVRQGFGNNSSNTNQPNMLVTPTSLHNVVQNAGASTRTRRDIGARVRDLVLALALCHNVTPTTEDEGGVPTTAYQASSPDEIAIVRWTESVGLRVVHRDRHSIALQSSDSSRIVVRVRIREIFPFTSESKRMGIILQYLEGSDTASPNNLQAGETWFYQKGADTVMTKIVAANDWLDEETSNMAREGLRTLVVGRRKLTVQQYAEFSSAYHEASLSLQSRDANMAEVISTHLEQNLELLGVTGVEDKLQIAVKPSLELLRNAGIKIWMLTGDKVETARCVAISAKLVSKSQHIHTITGLAAMMRTAPTTVSDNLTLLSANPESTALLIDGDSLSYLLSHHQEAFISLAVKLPAVIACRCSPTQKADVALLIRSYTKKRVACIGDGGNDVSMIQAADVGVGIVGKEGRQASLAADFSITQFHHLTKLLVWHGRNSYKRSAKLGQFVIHRGLLVSVAQAVNSIATLYQPGGIPGAWPNQLFRDWLLVSYATLYTQFPVFSLVLDRDVDEGVANLYPELYKELTSGKSLSYKTFFVWLAVSVYQGMTIQILSQFFTRSVDNANMLALAFTLLILNESIMVAMQITTWHWIMVASILGTIVLYVITLPALGSPTFAYFDLSYVWSVAFLWRLCLIAAISLLPPYLIKVVSRTVKPPSYRKVRGV